MDLGLQGATVCVSGGSKGMGRTCAVAFAREGARVVITGRDQVSIDDAVGELKKAGSPDAFGLQCTLPEPAEIERLFGAIEDRWGELNTLVNMAGPTDAKHLGGDFAQTPEESWAYFWEMGVMSIVRCSRLALPLMRKAGWGRIINVSSQTAKTGEPQQCGYMTTKAAVNALSKNMAWGLAKEDILVNSVTPGGVYTDLMGEHMRLTGALERGYDPNSLESAADWLAEYIGPRAVGVVGRVAKSEEIAPHIVLLGSKANTFCIGTNVAVDGGTDFSAG